MSAELPCKLIFTFFLWNILIFDRSVVLVIAHEDGIARSLGELSLTFLLRGAL